MTEHEIQQNPRGLSALRPKTAFMLGLGSVLVLAFIVGFFVMLAIVLKGKDTPATAGATLPTTTIVQPPSAAAGQPLGNQPSGPVNVSADDDAFLGKENAPVTIIEFSDFQCPFCRRFWKETLPQIKQAYIDTGKVKFVYRDFPLPFHAGATPAAEGAECAREQDKFWQLHDAIFQEQDNQGQGTIQFTADDVKKWAAKIGLNTSKFNQCLDSGNYKQEVEKDIADGSAAGVNGTPATFINGLLVSGAQPFAAFKVIIDEELKKLGK